MTKRNRVKLRMGYDQIELIHDSVDIMTSIKKSFHPHFAQMYKKQRIKRKEEHKRREYYKGCIRSPRWKECDITETPHTQITHKLVSPHLKNQCSSSKQQLEKKGRTINFKTKYRAKNRETFIRVKRAWSDPVQYLGHHIGQSHQTGN